jgi:hypothetical protein
MRNILFGVSPRHSALVRVQRAVSTNGCKCHQSTEEAQREEEEETENKGKEENAMRVRARADLFAFHLDDTPSR